MLQPFFEIHLGEQTLHLFPEKAVYWVEQSMLLVSDLHWGKAEVFNQHGIPIPPDILADDLRRLSFLLKQTGAKTLTVLGDMIHAPKGITSQVEQEVASWRKTLKISEWVLVRGNHERYWKGAPESWNLRIIENHWVIKNIILSHDPEPVSDFWVIAGHTHPVVKLNSAGDGIRLPCFHITGQTLTLPSFGQFTGGYEIDIADSGAIYAIADNQIVSIF